MQKQEIFSFFNPHNGQQLEAELSFNSQTNILKVSDTWIFKDI